MSASNKVSPTQKLVRIYGHLWICQLLLYAGLTVCFAIVSYSSVQRYYKYQVNVDVTPDSSMVQPMPSVTLCPVYYSGYDDDPDFKPDSGIKNFIHSIAQWAKNDSGQTFYKQVDLESALNYPMTSHLHYDYWPSIAKCVTYDGQLSPIGVTNGMYIDIHIEHVQELALFLHPKDQFYPFWNENYEARFTVTQPSFSKNKSTWMQINHELSLTRVEAINLDRNPCLNSRDEETILLNRSLSACIIRHLIDKIGCTFSQWKDMTSGDKPLCNGKKLRNMTELMHTFSTKSESDIYKITGCLSNCIKNRYDFKYTPTFEIPAKEELEPIMSLYFYYKSQNYHIESHSLLHTRIDVLSDMGGFLGLFLGHSMLSVGGGILRKLESGLIWAKLLKP